MDYELKMGMKQIWEHKKTVMEQSFFSMWYSGREKRRRSNA